MRLEYFQLIDRIVGIDAAEQSIRTEAIVPTDSTIFEGHFPGFPLMPGVLLTEAMAQTSGWLLIALQKFQRMPFLAGLKEVKFRDFVKPGEKLSLRAKLEHDGSGFAITQAHVERDGKPVCNATITFRVVEFPNAQFVNYMKDFAKTIQFPAELVP
ncbi:MAG: beta-hydroxyacyl-ACP dehydratase [Pseudolabrys sp.]|nr:beta-hydroxyacyl-ACP dehydratase [Pseudolabrys sp.]